MEYQIAETLKNPQPVWFSAFYPSMKPFRSGSKEPLVRIYLYGVDNESLFRKKLYDVIAADFQEKQDRDGFFEYKSNLEWIPDYYLVPKLKNENIYGMQCYERTCSLYAKSNRNVVFKASTEANLIINDWENIYNFAQKLIEEFEIKSDR